MGSNKKSRRANSSGTDTRSGNAVANKQRRVAREQRKADKAAARRAAAGIEIDRTTVIRNGQVIYVAETLRSAMKAANAAARGRR
jgi:hypothetical protein